ncbi:MAG TPA: hypothetical protein VFA20_09050 [Myxococcaceae bacterium]|nr:hypothetical protein [Myxococcaceae bacterium]
MAEIRERCPLFTENKPTPALPRDFAQLDNLIRHRALQMWFDARQLNGSATRSFRIYFGEETLPLVCARIEQARALVMAGQFDAAGRKYQALLVLSQLIELAIAVHATVEYADQVGELSLTLARTQETFGNQFKPLLEAALSEDPRRIEGALRASAPGIQDWLEYLQRWTAHIRADAERMVVAKAAWDITIGVIAAYETAGALAELVATGGPPVPPLPALGGGAAAMELSGTMYIELAESVRKLIASGALDAGVVAALPATIGGRNASAPPLATTSTVQMSATQRPPDTAQGQREAPSSLKGAQLQEYLRQAEQYGSGGVKVLENGRIRFYGRVTPARTPGEMTGARVVREWDPSTGAKRTWIETLDQQGTVRSIRPETGDPKVHQIFDANGNYVGPR